MSSSSRVGRRRRVDDVVKPGVLGLAKANHGLRHGLNGTKTAFPSRHDLDVVHLGLALALLPCGRGPRTRTGRTDAVWTRN